jgi:hypothetical protein
MRQRFWILYEIVLMVIVLVFEVFSVLGILDDFNFRDVLGEWRTGVAATAGFMGVIACIKYSNALDRLRSSRNSAVKLADRNRDRIAELRARLGKAYTPD